MANILLTGGRAPATLELARIFHTAGHQVFMAESIPGHLSQPSREIESNFLVPPPRQQSTLFISALRNIIVENHIDLLIPTCEEIFYISAHREALPCQVLVESIDNLRKVHNKWEFFLLLRELELDGPDTRLISKPEDFQVICGNGSSWVLKPVFSRFGSQVLIQPTPGEASKAITRDPDRKWIAQEYIPGSQICSYSVAHHGRLNAHAAYPSGFTAGVGATIVFSPISHPSIKAWVERFVDRTNFTGQIAFDFIETAAGKIYVLECNPRATSGVHLFASEPNFADAFINPTSNCLTPDDPSSSMLVTAMLMYGLPMSVIRRQFGKWLTTLISSRDVIFRYTDPLPFALQLRSLFFFMKVSHKQHISLLAASTFDIEWNGNEISGGTIRR